MGQGVKCDSCWAEHDARDDHVCCPEDLADRWRTEIRGAIEEERARVADIIRKAVSKFANASGMNAVGAMLEIASQIETDDYGRG